MARSRTTQPGASAAALLLGLLALLLPARDRGRFVGEVLANMAELRWRQRLGELRSVAAAVPGIAAILLGAAAAGVTAGPDNWRSWIAESAMHACCTLPHGVGLATLSAP